MLFELKQKRDILHEPENMKNRTKHRALQKPEVVCYFNLRFNLLRAVEHNIKEIKSITENAQFTKTRDKVVQHLINLQ